MTRGDLLIAQCPSSVQPVQQCLVLFSRHTRVPDPNFCTLLIFGSFISLHAVNPARLLLHPADSLISPSSPQILSLITLVWPSHSSHAGLMHLCSTRCVLQSKSQTLRCPKPVLAATTSVWAAVVAGRLPDVSESVLRCQHHNSTSPPLTTLFPPSADPPPRHVRGCEATTGVIIVCVMCVTCVSVNAVDCALMKSVSLPWCSRRVC